MKAAVEGIAVADLGFDPSDRGLLDAIRAHALACYPQEMCGAITPAGFEPLQNRHRDPLHHFDCTLDAEPLMQAGKLLALVHSHPDGPDAPSGDDIKSQRLAAIPFGLVSCNKDDALQPFFWGDELEPPPLEGRQFRHGPSGTDGRGDCGALVRDWFRLERGILIPDFARDDSWWMTPGVSLYEQHFAEAGFEEVPQAQAEAGDVVLMQFRTPQNNAVPNHAGIYLGRGFVMHHLAQRLSRVESVIGWMKHARKVLRHVHHDGGRDAG